MRNDFRSNLLIAQEKETWALVQRKDLQKFASYLTEDFYDIFPNGEERTKAELLEFLADADLKAYQLSKFRATMLNDDAAIVTCKVDARAVVKGGEISMHNAVISGWARRGGKWLNVSAVDSARPEANPE